MVNHDVHSEWGDDVYVEAERKSDLGNILLPSNTNLRRIPPGDFNTIIKWWKAGPLDTLQNGKNSIALTSSLLPAIKKNEAFEA